MSQTYVFDENGTVYLFRGKEVVASSTDLAELEQKTATLDLGVEANPHKPDTSTNKPSYSQHKVCQYCDDEGCHKCKSDDPTATDDVTEVLKHRGSKDTYVTTPNGLKGKVVSSVKGLWSDELTIRLDNGRIARFEVVSGEDYKFSYDDPETTSYKALRDRLDEVPSGTRESLVARIKDLKEIQTEAKKIMRTASYIDQTTLDEIIVMASHEIREAAEAIEALNDQETLVSPAFQSQVVEQASLGDSDASWLDQTLGEMIEETEAQDFDKLMDEGPEEFVTGLEDGLVPDSGEVRALASNFVTSKTIGIDPEAIEEFRSAFLARVESVRQQEESVRRAKVDAQVKIASKELVEAEGDAMQIFL